MDAFSLSAHIAFGTYCCLNYSSTAYPGIHSICVLLIVIHMRLGVPFPSLESWSFLKDFLSNEAWKKLVREVYVRHQASFDETRGWCVQQGTLLRTLVHGVT
jgi:hypothetical protein